jgi:hypothetical protein
MWAKAVWCITMATVFVIVSTKVNFPEAKFTAALFFGYTSFRIWGADKPN